MLCQFRLTEQPCQQYVIEKVESVRLKPHCTATGVGVVVLGHLKVESVRLKTHCTATGVGVVVLGHLALSTAQQGPRVDGEAKAG